MVVWFAFSAQALPSLLNNGITYQGRILKPDGTPLSGSNAQFILQIRSNDSYNCLLYQETRSAIDMSQANGTFSFTLNDGVGVRDTTLDSGLSMERVFANQGSIVPVNPITSANVCTGSPSTWTPGSSDARKLVVQFKDETMPGLETIPDVKINSAPFALSAAQVAGFPSSAIVRVAEVDGTLGNVLPLSAAKYANLLSLSANPASSYTSYGTLSGKALPTMGTNQVLGFDGTNWVSVPVTGGAQSVTSSMIANGAVDTAQLSATLAINTSGNIVTSGALQSATLTTPQIYGSTAASQNIKIDGTSNGAPGNVLLATGSGGGLVGIGTTAPGAKVDVATTSTSTSGSYTDVRDTLIVFPTAPSTANYWGTKSSVFYNAVSPNHLTGGVIRGAEYTATSNSSANVASLYGFVSTAQNTGSGTVASAIGNYSYATNIGAGTMTSAVGANNQVVNSGAGVISDARGLSIGVSNSGAGSITAGYGLFIGPIGATNKYSIYSSDATAPSYFAGAVGIGTTAVNAKTLDVESTLTQTANVYYQGVLNSTTVAPTSASSSQGYIGTLNTINTSSSNMTNQGMAASNSNASVFDGGTGQIESVVGVGGNAQDYANNRTVNNALGGNFLVQTGSTNGVINNAYGISSQVLNSGGTTIGNAYGVWVGTVNGTKKYSLYTTDSTAPVFVAGKVGIGTTSPSALLNLAAGSAVAGTSPLKFTTGALNTTPEDGAMEYASSVLYYTIGSTRYSIPLVSAAGNISNSITNINSTSSISLNPVTGNSVLVTSGTSSTTSTSGALIVTGGVGVSENLNVGSNITAAGSMTSTLVYSPQIYGSSTAGASIKIDGNDSATKGNVLLATAGGSVGIGTTAPSAALHVRQFAAANGQIQTEGNGSSSTSGVDFYQLGARTGFVGTRGSGSSAPTPASGGTMYLWNDLYLPLVFGTFATERMRIDQSGNVGIGTTSMGAFFHTVDSSFRTGNTTGVIHAVSNLSTAAGLNKVGMDIESTGSWNGAGSTNTGLLVNATGGATNYAAIFNGGYVGIGTTSPSVALDVVGSAKVSSALTVTGGITTNGNPLFVSSGTATSGANFNSPALYLIGKAWDGAASGQDQWTLQNIVGTGANPTSTLTFDRGGSYSTGTRKYAFMNGNVGIGTTSPYAKLSVLNNLGNVDGILVAKTTLTDRADIAFIPNGAPSPTNVSYYAGLQAGAFNNYSINTWDGTTFGQPLTIQSNGNVGIGTTNPNFALDVNGAIRNVGTSFNNQYGTTLYSSNGALSNTAGFVTNNTANVTGTAQYYGVSARGVGNVDQYSYLGSISTGSGYTPVTVLGQSTSATNYIERLRIDSSGNVGIGTTAPGEMLEVNGNVKAQSFVSTSDRRLKTSIQTSSGLDIVRQLVGVTWLWKNNGLADAGVIAQDVEKVMPNSVVTDSTTGYKAVKYNTLFAPLIEATKELDRKVASVETATVDLQKDNADLKKENAQLKSDLNDLKNRMKAIEAALKNKKN